MAALICARLAHFVSGALKSRFPSLKVKLWSDNELVLHWLLSTKPLKQFISNRTQEIKKLFPVAVWSHCPTHDNPADMLTRGINTTPFHSFSLWPHGPQWLPFVEQWPSWTCSRILNLQFSDPATAASNAVTMTDGTTQTDPEDKQPGIHSLIDVSTFSSLSSLLAVPAYVLRFVKNLQNNATKTLGPLSVQERQNAQRKWIQNSQAQIYAEGFLTYGPSQVLA